MIKEPWFISTNWLYVGGRTAEVASETGMFQTRAFTHKWGIYIVNIGTQKVDLTNAV